MMSGRVIQFPEQHEGLTLELAPTGTDCVDPVAEFYQIQPAVIPTPDIIRQQARSEALRIVEAYRQDLLDGNFSDVPLDVDALGTARKVREVRDAYGSGSPEHTKVRAGLILDCDRKWAEAHRKNSWEYFPPIVQTLDPEKDQLYADGLSVDDMVRNGLSPTAEPEETAIRVDDYVHLHLNKTLLKAPENEDMAAVRVYLCPDWAIESYRRNPKGSHGGYAPEIEKLMINYDTFDPKTNQITHEQLGVAGTYITTDVVACVLNLLGAASGNVDLSKMDIHGMTSIVPTEAVSSSADVLRLLDQVATETHGLNVFMGEVVPDNYLKNYSIVYTESEARQTQRKHLAEELAQYVEELEYQKVDPALATVLVEKYIQKIMLGIARRQPEQAEIIFNRETAEGFREVRRLEELGMVDLAKQQLEAVELNAPQASSCGSGSCGIEGVDKDSKLGKELAKLVGAEEGDEIAKDTERACKCGKKEIVYAYNKSKVNKKCLGCGAFESKRTSRRSN